MWRAEFKSYEPERRWVTVRSPVGTFSAAWEGDSDPVPGDQCYVEFSTGDDAIWGVDVTDASPDEPDAILQDENYWTFVGRVVVLDENGHVVQKPIPPDDLEQGFFFLEVGDQVVMIVAEGLPSDASGCRVRVRQA